MLDYEVLITDEILSIRNVSKRDRQQILSFIDSLRIDPFQPGDYSETDHNGRMINLKIIGKYALTFWADHAVKEVKITKIRNADF